MGLVCMILAAPEPTVFKRTATPGDLQISELPWRTFSTGRKKVTQVGLLIEHYDSGSA
jgi:hypothetical protein